MLFSRLFGAKARLYKNYWCDRYDNCGNADVFENGLFDTICYTVLDKEIGNVIYAALN